MTKLDPEERELLDSFERGEWQSVPNIKAEIKRYQEYAKRSLEHNRQVKIYIPQSDFVLLEKTASKNGIPYQMLLSGIIHDYVSNQQTGLTD